MSIEQQDEEAGASLAKAEYERLAAFRHALRQFLHFSETVAVEVGLTPQQHQALLAIRGAAGRDYLTVGELAERLLIRHHSAVGLIDRLESQGFVSREVSPTDRRQVHIALTEQGKAILERLSTAHKEELRRVGPVLRQLLEDVAGDS